MKNIDLSRILICAVCKKGALKSEQEILICNTCGARFKVKERKVFFRDYAGIWPTPKPHATDQTRWSVLRKRNYDFYKYALKGVSADSLMLDLGTGQEQFRNLFDRYRRVGADFVPYERVDVVCDFSMGLPFRDETFDVIVASNVFEHLPDAASVLQECFRVLRPNGKLFFTVPFLLRTHQEPYDFVRYTNFMLEKIVKEAGFTDIIIEPLGTPEDVYRVSEQHFFMQLFDKMENEGILKKILLKIIWNIKKLTNVIGAHIYQRLSPSLAFTLGYAVTTVKKQ